MIEAHPSHIMINGSKLSGFNFCSNCGCRSSIDWDKNGFSYDTKLLKKCKFKKIKNDVDAKTT